jgi:hypothetical protein
MGGPWIEQSNERSIRLVVAPVARARAQDPRIASETVTAAVVGFVVALLTSLVVSLTCFALLQGSAGTSRRSLGAAGRGSGRDRETG